MDLFGEDPAPVKEEKIKTVDMTDAEPEEGEQARDVKVCFGHDAVETKLNELMTSERPPHGLIFSGPKGIGKSTMAYQLTRFLFTQSTSLPEDIVARRVASGAHPDLLSIERSIDPVKGKQKASVDVAEIRKVTPFLRRTASEGGWRIVIIDDADTMNRNAQNALLKILEEPPEKTLLVLIAHRAGALIPTIRSRCRVVPFQPLGDDVMTRLLQTYDLSPYETDMLIALAGGSFGKALEYIEEDALETLKRILGLIESYPVWDWPQIHVLADELSRPGQERAFQAYQNLMQFIWSQLVLTKARGQNTGEAPLNTEVFAALLQNSSLETLSKICENLQEHFETVQRANLDKRQGVLGAFSLMKAA
ncbi:MAG: DNA polymerase III subunit delta' [Micavibrio sp.]|nr:MAG: DNA polymerase III subunit delta' [Micavibrio sp.]